MGQRASNYATERGDTKKRHFATNTPKCIYISCKVYFHFGAKWNPFDSESNEVFFYRNRIPFHQTENRNPFLSVLVANLNGIFSRLSERLSPLGIMGTELRAPRYIVL